MRCWKVILVASFFVFFGYNVNRMWRKATPPPPVLLLLVSFFLSDFLFIFWIPSSKSCLGCEAKVCQGTWDPGDRHPRNFGLDITTPCVTISLLCKRQAAVILYEKCRASRHKKTSREVRERSSLRTGPIIVGDDGRTRTLYSTIEGEEKKKKREQQKERETTQKFWKDTDKRRKRVGQMIGCRTTSQRPHDCHGRRNGRRNGNRGGNGTSKKES